MQHVNAMPRILCVMQSVLIYYANYLTYKVKVTPLQETIAWLVEQGLSLRFKHRMLEFLVIMLLSNSSPVNGYLFNLVSTTQWKMVYRIFHQKNSFWLEFK